MYAQEDANLRRARSAYGYLVLLCTLSLFGLIVYKLYLGPYAARYQDRLEARNAAADLISMANSICLPQNIVRTRSVARCAEAERVLGRSVWYGALTDMMDQLTVFSWIFGTGADGYSLFSPEQLFRLASVSIVLIAVLWVLSACSFLVSGHAASAARYEIPLTIGHKAVAAPAPPICEPFRMTAPIPS